jgi:hypothetical protein
MKKLTPVFAMLLITIILNPELYAGGPLSSYNGKAVIYQSSNFPISYNSDKGSLGSFDSSQATTLVASCFQTWQDVTTATITFQDGGQLPVDVNATNYSTYLNNFSDGINPIIFDSDGTIIDAEYGSGASENIIGFAGSSTNGSGYYTEGLAVLNGRFSTVFTYDQFKATFFHEFGHFFGLDHTQINGQYVGDGNTSNDIYVPTMYPTATDDDTALGDPNPDDEVAITLLYPASNASTTYAKIKGTVKWESGQAVLGANVVAVKIGDEDMSQFSSISDYYQQNNGEYEMYLLPGDYKLFIEPIDQAFTGGSSVGPYSEDLNQPSFTSPVEKEYYNGNDESGNETDLNDFVVVTVVAGQTVSDIDFIAESGASSTTTTISGSCPPDYPVDCGNGYCCSLAYPICCADGSCCQQIYPVCCADGYCYANQEDCLCPTGLVLGNDEIKMNVLRKMRDDRMQSSKIGVSLIDLYYGHAEEISDILLGDDELIEIAADVVGEIVEKTAALNSNGEVNIGRELVDDILDLADKIDKDASPSLKTAIRKVKKEIEKGEIFRELGIKAIRRFP